LRCFLALSEDWTSEKKESVQADVAYTLFFIVADSGHRSADRSGISVLDLC
jgi:hypothetical protein